METTAPEAAALVIPPVRSSREMIFQLAEESQLQEQTRAATNRQIMQEVLKRFIEEANLPALQTLARAMENQATKAGQHLKLTEEVKATVAATARASSWKLIAILCLLSLMLVGMVGGGLFVYLKRPDLLSPAQAPAIAQTPTIELEKAQKVEAQRLQERTSKLREEVAALEAQKATVKESNQVLATANAALGAANSALTANRKQAQEDLRVLQQLQQAYQFRLMPVEGTNQVVVEIPQNAEAFVSQGKNYIAVTQPK